MAAKQLLVVDVMSTDPIVLGSDVSIEEADDLLRSTYITGLPVVDSDGVLVGVITRADLTAYRFADRLPQSNGSKSDPASLNR